MPPALEMTGVRVWRVRPGGDRTPLLDGIDWRVGRGERWAVLGPNGAGKTTLLGLAGAVSHPGEGAVRVLGHALGAVDVRELRARIGHVDAALATAFHPRMTAFDVALTGATGSIVPLADRVSGADRARAAELLAVMGCGPIATRRFARMSRGEQQRVLLARALVPRPRLLLLDEPTAGLDLPGRELFLERLDAVAGDGDGLTTVQVSHHLEELGAGTTHALLLRGGRVVAAGPVGETLREEPLSRCFGAPVRVTRAAGRVLAVIDRAGE